MTPRPHPFDPVFVFTKVGQSLPLTRMEVDPVFKSGLATARVNPRLYGWSSFRRGGATTCFLATRDVESLRVHGDWASSAYTRYLAIPAVARNHLTAALQNTLF